MPDVREMILSQANLSTTCPETIPSLRGKVACMDVIAKTQSGDAKLKGKRAIGRITRFPAGVVDDRLTLFHLSKDFA